MEKFAPPDVKNGGQAYKNKPERCLKYAYCERNKMGLKIYKEADCASGTIFDPDSGTCKPGTCQ